jgi:hypothetical protein
MRIKFKRCADHRNGNRRLHLGVVACQHRRNRQQAQRSA